MAPAGVVPLLASSTWIHIWWPVAFCDTSPVAASTTLPRFESDRSTGTIVVVSGANARRPDLPPVGASFLHELLGAAVPDHPLEAAVAAAPVEPTQLWPGTVMAA